MRIAAEPALVPSETRRPRPLRAMSTRGSVQEESLLELCRAVGLEGRAADVRRLARASVRLTPGASEDDAVGACRLGGAPDLPQLFDWPTWQGCELGFLGQLNLERVAALDRAPVLPPEGLLLFFYDLEGRPSGLLPSHRGSCRVILLDGDLDRLEPDRKRSPALRGMPVELSRELMLPGAWSFQAEELDLSSNEAEAWDELRAHLAAAQGVELEESAVARLALHRLLGYHEELGREVEVDCELASVGLDAADAGIYFGSRGAHESVARAWRLLLQLSADDDLETPWDEGFDRLYLCIRDSDLRAGNLDAAWAVLR